MGRLGLAVALAGLAFLGAGCAGTHHADASMRPGGILASGKLVEGSGGICAGRDGVFFSPYAVPRIVESPPPTVCDGQVRLHGFDLASLKLEPVGHGVRLGSAYVRGVYRSGVLTVIAQGPPRRQQPKSTRDVLPGLRRVGATRVPIGARSGYSVAAVKAAFSAQGVELVPFQSSGGKPAGATWVNLIGPQAHPIHVNVRLGPYRGRYKHLTYTLSAVGSDRAQYRNVLLGWRPRDQAVVMGALHRLK